MKTLAVNVARVGHPVALFSLEMQRKKVALNIPNHGERHRWHGTENAPHR